MFGIGGFELFIILLFGFLLFGPDKLPEMAKTLGAALRKFKQAQAEMESVIKEEVLDPDAGKKKQSSKPAPSSSTETFAERKARYDKERSERLARTQQEAARAEMKKEAAEKAAQIDVEQAKAEAPAASVEAKPVANASDSAEPAAASVEAAPASQAKPAAAEPTAKPAATAKPAPPMTPDELFGNKPIKPAPAAAKVADAAPASEAAAKGGE